MYIKKFAEWLGLKEKVHSATHKVPFVKQFEIYWVHMGVNIGSEIDGKNNQFSRPGIVFKKLSHDFYFIIPTTTQKKEGSWYVEFNQGGRKIYACLHQARVVDYRRLTNRVGHLDDEDRKRISDGFKKLYCS